MKTQLPKHRILLTKSQIDEAILKMAEQITRDYQGKDLLVVGILKGSFIFTADLVRQIDLPLQVEFMGVSSYEGEKSTGKIVKTHDLACEIKDRHVIVVEDIIDTGNTLDYLIETMQARSPASLKVCSLLTKPAAHKKSYNIDYQGFEIENLFVLGYGLDLDGLYRNIPHIIVLNES